VKKAIEQESLKKDDDEDSDSSSNSEEDKPVATKAAPTQNATTLEPITIKTGKKLMNFNQKTSKK